MIELLVVMGIMAVMAGITAASFVGVTRRASREGARENIMDVLRQARVSAVDTGRGAVVRIDPAANSIYGIATNVIGAWHFEEVNGDQLHARRAALTTARSTVGTTLVSGKLGLAFHFNGTGLRGLRRRPDLEPDHRHPPGGMGEADAGGAGAQHIS